MPEDNRFIDNRSKLLPCSVDLSSLSNNSKSRRLSIEFDRMDCKLVRNYEKKKKNMNEYIKSWQLLLRSEFLHFCFSSFILFYFFFYYPIYYYPIVWRKLNVVNVAVGFNFSPGEIAHIRVFNTVTVVCRHFFFLDSRSEIGRERWHNPSFSPP